MMGLVIALISFVGYGSTTDSQSSDFSRSDKHTAAPNDIGQTEQITDSKGKILVAYFSHSGNTRLIANQIHDLVGGDIFEIKTVKQYNKDFETTVDEARKELHANARPELAAKLENMKNYEVIFIGFPNWCGTMPMALFTFLEQYDFKDKTVVPFCTHGTSGLSNAINDLNKLVPHANVREALGIYRQDVRNADNTVKTWLRNLGYKSKSLIVYYSLSGNTKTVAGYLQGLVGADIAEIKTVSPYPDDFHAVVEQAREERRTGYLPPIQPIPNNMQDYDTIYLGYPVWGNTIPQPMATFLSQNKLAGKTVIPFCTHDGYGVGHSFQVISGYCQNAKVLTGFDMLGSNARSAENLLLDWLKGIGISLPNDGDRVNINKPTTPITITIGNTVLSGILNDSPTAREFIAGLPQTISMGAYGGREYYGGIASRIDTNEAGRLRFDDGDITYCPQNNTVAIFFAQTGNSNLTMRVIPIGKITTDLSVFQHMDRSIQATFSLSR